MNEKNDFEINLARLFSSLWKFLPVILLFTALVSLVASFAFRTPAKTTYVSKASFLVKTNMTYTDIFVEDQEPGAVESHTAYTAINVVETYCYLATSPYILDTVITQADLPYTTVQLSGMVSARQELAKAMAFTVQIEHKDKDEALRIARAFAEALPAAVKDLTPNAMVAVLDGGSVSAQTSGGTNIKKIITVAAAAFVVAALAIAALYVIKEYTGNNSIRTSDLARLYPRYRILSAFSSARESDATKRLRANLRLALSDSEGCRLIGLTAAHSDLAKDDLAFDLASSLAELGDRVLLVDADLRSHRLHGLAKLEKSAGLSELIRSNEKAGGFVQNVNGKGAFSLLPAGEGSDAASELLDSRKLLPVLRELKSSYDYILLDLEAIGSSVDAASVGKELDGIVVALRDDCCKRNQLDRCVSQLEYASAKILGFAVLEKKSLQKRK